MCVGLPAEIVGPAAGHPDLAVVDIAGVRRTITMSVLDDRLVAGDWVLVHMGFGMSADAGAATAAVAALHGAPAGDHEPRC